MDINIGVKLHNKFEFEVRDIKTGEILQKEKAENMVLTSMYSALCSSNTVPHGNAIIYGKGTGTLSESRTTLFNRLGTILSTVVETVINQPPAASYCKRSIVIPAGTHTGETLTEVGISIVTSTTGTAIVTHALIEDAEGNPISIGPLTDTQEVTIFSTVFADNITLPTNTVLPITAYGNELLYKLVGHSKTDYLLGGATNISSSGTLFGISSDKTATNPSTLYSVGDLGQVAAGFTTYDVPNKSRSTARLRRSSTDSNGKIWSIFISRASNTSSLRCGILRTLFPSSAWGGYNFISKGIGTGDGTTVTFNLPWSDINTSKTYKIYVDGVEKTQGADYTLSNSESTTSVTFTTAPANGLPITGDWWVDYIPKDSDHVLDFTFKITFGSV